MLFAAVAGAGTGALAESSPPATLDETLQPPDHFRVLSQDPTTVSLGWDAVAGASGYTLFRAPMNADGTPGAFSAIAPNISPGTSPVTYDDASADDNGSASYVYRVAANNASGAGTQSSDLIASTTFPLGGGQGWSAYFSDTYSGSTDDIATPANAEYIGLFNQDLNLTGFGEQDRFPTTPVSFNTNGNPGQSFAATFRGRVTAPSTAAWTFYTATGDGVRVTVDGVVLFDNFTTARDLPAADDVIPVKDAQGNPLIWTAGSVHDVRVEWEQGSRGWDVRVQWAPNGDLARKSNIPLAAINPVQPQAPVAVAAYGDTGLQIIWQQVDAVSYKIERSDDNGVTWHDVPGTTTPATPATAFYSRVVGPVAFGQPFYFRVEATNAGGSSSAFVTGHVDGGPPAPPTNVGAVAGSFADATHVNVAVSWDAAPLAATYTVERAEVDVAGKPGVFQVLSDSVTASPYDDLPLVGKRYVYRVSARNNYGDSPVSPNSPILNLGQVDAPSRPLARVLDNGDVKLTWNDLPPVGSKISVLRWLSDGTYAEIAQVDPVAGGGGNSYIDKNAKLEHVYPASSATSF